MSQRQTTALIPVPTSKTKQILDLAYQVRQKEEVPRFPNCLNETISVIFLCFSTFWKISEGQCLNESRLTTPPKYPSCVEKVTCNLNQLKSGKCCPMIPNTRNQQVSIPLMFKLALGLYLTSVSRTADTILPRIWLIVAQRIMLGEGWVRVKYDRVV